MNRRHFLSLAAAGTGLAAQQPDPSQVITLDVARVNLLFTVSDKRGRFVNDLTKEYFDVFEDNRKQTITEFAAETDIPLRIAVIVDTSNSIRDRFRFELETAAQFLESVIRPGKDKALIYSFDTEAHLTQGLTDNTEILSKKLRELRPGGGTALFDAIFFSCRDHLGIEQPRHKFRRAAIIIGDGEDNSSHYTRDQTLEMANKSETVLYTISTNMTRVESAGDRVLKYFSSETGGLSFFPFKAEDLAQDFENIANEMRSQYSILYRPEPPKNDGRFHSVQIKVKNRKGLNVRTRKTYFSPKM